MVGAVVDWFASAARPLPWRAPTCTPWGVLVSEVMLQQTQVARGLPVWQAWIERWPTATALADAPLADVLVAWGRMGYPRRARWLHQAAQIIRDEHGGDVPRDLAALRALPGIGEYTAAAVLAFAFGEPTVVLDTNVRRVIERAWGGTALPPAHLTNAERERAASLVSIGGARWSAAVMELGALVCSSRSPDCSTCPLMADCAWRERGMPAAPLIARRQGRFEGSDRQARGTVMAAVRAGPVRPADIVWPDAEQRDRAIASLEADGLVARVRGRLHLP